MGIFVYIVTDPVGPQQFKRDLYDACEKGENMNVFAAAPGSDPLFFSLRIALISPDPDNFFVTAKVEHNNEWANVTVSQDKVKITVVR